MNDYSNLPISKSEKNSTIQAFDAYYSKPLEIDNTIFAATKAFFTSRNFDDSAAETIAIVIIRQAKQDGYNTMQILDTLRGLSDIEMSGVVSEILNYNRFKSSSLGYANPIKTNPEILRNIIP